MTNPISSGSDSDADRPKSWPALDRRAAYHEAGHAVASTAIRWQPVLSCGIGGEGEGDTVYDLRPSECRLRDLRREIAVLLAGRASEELFLGEASARAGGGPQSDLAKATQLLWEIDTRSGLGWHGLVWRGEATIDDEAAKWLRIGMKTLYGAVQRVLETNRDVVEALAAALIAHRSVEGTALAGILEQVRLQVYDRL